MKAKALFCLLFSSVLFCANAQSELETLSQSTSSSSIALYTVNGKTEISRIVSSSNYRIIERAGAWLLVSFNQPTVPVWVSQNYLVRDGNRVRVTASSLNARLRPSLGAQVLMGISRGYLSDVLASRDGFVQIKAPSSLVVAIANSAHASVQTDSISASTSAAPVTPLVDKAKKVGETSVANTLAGTAEPSPVAATKTFESAVSREHVLAPGDAISVLIFGEPDLSITNARIPENGQISFPLIGSMAVAGSTTNSVENQLRAKYSQGYVRSPKLSVTIFSYRPIFIRGGVRNTGAFPYTEGLTIAKVLALAGGTRNSARRNGISVLRDGETVKSELPLDSQYLIVSGDVITVAEDQGVSEDSSAFIYLHGEVNTPGEYLYRKDLTVEKAIVLAGGFSFRASRRKVSVTRYVEDQEKPEKFRKVKLYFPVQPGDIINVGARLF